MSARYLCFLLATACLVGSLGSCTPAPTPDPSQLDKTPVEGTETPPPPTPAALQRAEKQACIARAPDVSPAQFGVVKAFCSDVINAAAPGAVFIMRTTAEPPLELTHGVRCNGAEHPVDLDTPFRLASVTKPFTAALVLRLVAEDRLELDAPIATYLPELRRSPWGEPTLAELLRHTAGLPDQIHVVARTPPGAPANDDAWVASLATVPAEFGSPRGTFRYSNLGYDLAGKIAARTLDRPWHDAVESKVIEPLGLEHTTAHESRATDPACGHLAATSPGITVTADRSITVAEHDWKRPSGSLIGTAQDLDRFVSAVTAADEAADDPLSRGLAMSLERPIDAEHGQQQTLGWRRLPGAGVPVYRHTGMMGHFSAEVYFSADGQFTLAYVVNAKTRLRGAVVAALDAYTEARITND